MNYTRFNRIENKKTFINVIRSYFDKKYALEQHIIEIYNQLEYAKREYNYDTYKELIIELISIERNRRQSAQASSLMSRTQQIIDGFHRIKC
jgi:hypothetical protein